MTCCGTLDDDDDAEDCEESAGDADAKACSDSLTELCPDPPVTITPVNACSELSKCCSTLEEDAEACTTTATQADPTACTSSYNELCAAADDD
jgi:hypothetical protein